MVRVRVLVDGNNLVAELSSETFEEMKYPAENHGVSKAKQNAGNLLGASSRAWTRGAMKIGIGHTVHVIVKLRRLRYFET